MSGMLEGKSRDKRRDNENEHENEKWESANLGSWDYYDIT